MRIGIDIGSRFTKIVYPGREDELFLMLLDSAVFYRRYGRSDNGKFYVSLKSLGLPDDAEIIATGYGRERAKLSGAKEISEIHAHAIGAMHMVSDKKFTLVDLGGQDVKAIRIENGKVVDFRTSDRCAASTGRFLENMAKILSISLEELSKHYENPEKISATCAVFAESEILEKISYGISIARISAGINYAVARKILPIIRYFGVDRLYFCGGASINNAIIQIINKELHATAKVLYNAQFIGAIGAYSYNISLSEKIHREKIKNAIYIGFPCGNTGF